MDKNTFEHVLELGKHISSAKELLSRFEKVGDTYPVTVVFNDSISPITEKFKESLKTLLSEYEEEINRL